MQYGTRQWTDVATRSPTKGYLQQGCFAGREGCRCARASERVCGCRCEADWVAALAQVAEHGPLYGLVNNAAIYQPQPLVDTTADAFDRHVQINLRGSFLGPKYGAQAMIAAGGGVIVNISSTAGLRASGGSFAYSATKWGLRGMTLSAAASLAEHGIRVNAVYPGPIDTDMLKVRTAQQLAERVQRVPLKRMGTVGDVAGMVLFLLSDESAYMTGAEITVDGGVTL